MYVGCYVLCHSYVQLYGNPTCMSLSFFKCFFTCIVNKLMCTEILLHTQFVYMDEINMSCNCTNSHSYMEKCLPQKTVYGIFSSQNSLYDLPYNTCIV